MKSHAQGRKATLAACTASVVLALFLGGCGGGSSDAAQQQGGGTRSAVVANVRVDSAGGTVSVTDPSSPLRGTTVVIPAGALANPTMITISEVTGDARFPAGALVARLGPEGTVFSAPVIVTVKFLQEYLTANGITDLTTLKVVEASAGVANETLATIALDAINRTLSARITHFSSVAAVGYSNASLSGTYSLAEYYRAPIANDFLFQLNVPGVPFSGNLSETFSITGFTSQLSTATFDGAGGVFVSQAQNRDGVVTTTTEGATYSVAADGTLTIGNELRGSVLAGGSTFILAGISGDPSIGVGIKKGGTFSNASLTGTYTLAEYLREPGTNTLIFPINVPGVPFTGTSSENFNATGFISYLSTVTFDGAGGVSLSHTRNQDGVVTTSTQTDTYSVAADGTLTAGGLTGTVLAGGSTFILSATSGTPAIGVGVRKAGSFTNASLTGSYEIVDYSREPQPNNLVLQINIPGVPFSGSIAKSFNVTGFGSYLSTATFDGAGGVSLSQTRNQDGVVTTATETSTYSVAADGTLTAGGLTGTVLSGGSTFVLSSVSGNPSIGIGILR